MAANLLEDEINHVLYSSNKDWVSVETKLHRELNPSELLQLTEAQAGDRFYLRLNDNKSSFFGYHAIQKFQNNFDNKQNIFREWEKFKHDIELIYPETDKHHLRICGGFQFSSHKSDDEWREFSINHFIVPEVLISRDEEGTVLTYTTKRLSFDMSRFKEIIDYFEHADITLDDDEILNVTKMEDIYKDEWRDLVQETIDYIDAHKKIVLTRRRLVKFANNINIAHVLERAMANERNSYIFLIESNESIFISQTPEQLFKVENHVLSTKAVAGTIKRTHEEAEDKANVEAFLNDRKNLDEHRFVVNSILNDIEPYVTQVDYNKTPNILKNDHLYHLYTQITGKLNDKPYSDLIDFMHPTPALGGYPKEEALRYIEQKEFGTRGLYGSPVGFIDVYNDCEFIVAIRSMLVKQNQATLFAGCGIVKESNPDSEVAETAVKFLPMMNALGVVNKNES